MDSLDSYGTLLDSLSSTLSGMAGIGQCSTIHGCVMNQWCIVGPEITLGCYIVANDYMLRQPHFTLCKWASSKNRTGEEKFEDKLNSDGPQLRHCSQFSGTPEFSSATKGALLIVDDQVQKERSKSLSMFGTLVSPKLRAAQLSFETALETLVEIVNVRFTMLSTSDQVRKELEGPKG